MHSFLYINGFNIVNVRTSATIVCLDAFLFCFDMHYNYLEIRLINVFMRECIVFYFNANEVFNAFFKCLNLAFLLK